VCALADQAAVTARLIAAARAAGKRCVFFATEARLWQAAGLRAMQVGEQPVWDPTGWAHTLATTPRLREQLRRAERKGVRVRRVDGQELRRARPAIERLVARWLHAREMAPMGFLVDVCPFDFPEERRYFVAERAGELVGFLALVPIYQRPGWLFEDFLRDRNAPNGTAELLISAGMRAIAAEGSNYATLGLAPLSGRVPRWLRATGWAGTPLYRFASLRAFKAKLQPARWDPIYLAYPPHTSGHVALIAALRAFARGSLLRFGGATLLRGPALVVRLLTVLLAPWTLLLGQAGARWFPRPWVKPAWVGLDVALLASLLWLTVRWRHALGVAVAATITLDAVLTTAQVAAFNLHHVTRALDGVALVLAIAGPAGAALVLWGAVGHRRTRPDAMAGAGWAGPDGT
jgi:phosphatidylglycerol lysyltransferase